MVSWGAAARCAVASLSLILLSAMAPSPGHAANAGPSCTDLLPQSLGDRSKLRGISANDLVRLRDIGSPDAADPDVPSPLAVSPDGRLLAFVITRADPVANDYCRALVVKPLDGAGNARIVDRGGDYVMTQGFVRSLTITIGTPRTIAPVWSRDGRTLFYLKRLQGSTQVWRVDVASRRAIQLSHSGFDIETLMVDPATGRLFIGGRPGRVAAESAIDEEALTGWHYDARVATHSGARPKVRESEAPLVVFTLDPRSGALGVAQPDDHHRYDTLAATNSGLQDLASDGRIAAIGRATTRLLDPGVITLTDASGSPKPCSFEACTGKVTGLWWDRFGRTLTFARHEGWNGESTALYRWIPDHGEPHRILLANDALQGCVKADVDLICTDDSVKRPRRIVYVSLSSGEIAEVYDPNPEFAHIVLGSVQRLRWRNNRGLPAWGDLVLPPGYRPEVKVPMVVVQYHSRGFLRGGTNQEYPIYLFASHGMAVLSIEVPPFIGVLDPNLKTIDDLERADFAGWAEQKSLVSSLETGVAAAIATGAIDPTRIGITGLSNGSTVARYALITTHLFKAAAISSCCFDPNTVMTYGGIAWADFNRRVGFPSVTEQHPDFWAPVSLAQNAATLDTPILMQLADEEYLLALEAFEALREYEKPVELYVFLGEHHGKWQPAHRLAIYQRSVDWFDFWLQGREDPSPAKRAQFNRWETMRAKYEH